MLLRAAVFNTVATAAMPQNWEDWQDIVQLMLEGINRYNPDNVETLEEYVQFQAEGDDYDFEANLTLMKLYLFEPNRLNRMVALQVLLKALVNMPHPLEECPAF